MGRTNRPKEGYRLPLNQERRRVDAIEKTAHIDRNAAEIVKRLETAFETMKATKSEGLIDISLAINHIASLRNISSEIRNILIAMQYGPERPEDD